MPKNLSCVGLRKKFINSINGLAVGAVNPITSTLLSAAQMGTLLQSDFFMHEPVARFALWLMTSSTAW
jgi:hypothetical protein